MQVSTQTCRHRADVGELIGCVLHRPGLTVSTHRSPSLFRALLHQEARLAGLAGPTWDLSWGRARCNPTNPELSIFQSCSSCFAKEDGLVSMCPETPPHPDRAHFPVFEVETEPDTCKPNGDFENGSIMLAPLLTLPRAFELSLGASWLLF